MTNILLPKGMLRRMEKFAILSSLRWKFGGGFFGACVGLRRFFSSRTEEKRISIEGVSS
jgi:hypothetical protein